MLGLNDIFGQEAAVGMIRRAYAADRLPHGLIFAGPAGVGKATTARALGALFLCEKPGGDGACGRCESCVVMAAGNHPDYHVVYRQLIRLEKEGVKARDLAVDVVRHHLIEPAGLKPVMNRGKVFVVEEAELMNPQAQNALLKTLEEPYGRTLTVLLTDQPGALLPTIRSRCQVVRFAALPEVLVKRELERRGIDRALAADATRVAGGSLGVALQWIEDGVVAGAGELVARLDAASGGRGAGDMPVWFRKAAEAYAEKQLERDKLASKDQATREGLTLYLKLSAARFRQRLAETDDPDALERACSAIDAIVRAENYLDSNVNIALTFQQLASALSREFVRQ